MGTVYDITGDAVAMVNTRTCNSHEPAGCAATPPQFTAGSYPGGVAVDPLTHTVYVANFGSVGSAGPGSVSVVNADTCNATDQAGCSESETLTVPGGNADDLAVDVATGTLYVGTETASGPDLVSVFNASTCNAIDTAGCSQVPGAIQFGSSGGSFDNSQPVIAVNQVTNTIYATDSYDFSSTGPARALHDQRRHLRRRQYDGLRPGPRAHAPRPELDHAPQARDSCPGASPSIEATDTVYVTLLSNGDYAADGRGRQRRQLQWLRLAAGATRSHPRSRSATTPSA